MKYRYFDMIISFVGEMLGLYGLYKHDTFYVIGGILLIIIAKNRYEDYLK